MLNLKQPSTKKEVRSLIGLINYYRKFIPNFPLLAAPLTDLTRKGSPDKIKWSDECQNSLSQIQKCLSSDPILILPDVSSKFFLRTDASSRAIGAVLLQQRDGLLRPVQFAGRKLLDRETKYCIMELECLAIVFGCSHFQRYLMGTQFVVQTDHKPLAFLKQNKSKNARIFRWFLYLQEFSFKLESIPGSENYMADIMSRLI